MNRALRVDEREESANKLGILFVFAETGSVTNATTTRNQRVRERARVRAQREMLKDARVCPE